MILNPMGQGKHYSTDPRDRNLSVALFSVEIMESVVRYSKDDLAEILKFKKAIANLIRWIGYQPIWPKIMIIRL